MELDAFLREARKAQLQEYYLRWFPGEELAGAREKLAERLGGAMRDPQKVRCRFDRLPRAARDFLLSLVGREGYCGTVHQIRGERRSRAIEDFEVEGLVRSLLDEGLLASENQPGSDGGWREVLLIPRELGDALRRTVDIEERETGKMLRLADHLDAAPSPGLPLPGLPRDGLPRDGAQPGPIASGSASSGTASSGTASSGTAPAEGSGAADGSDTLAAALAATNSLSAPIAVAERIRGLADPKLRELVETAIRDHAGILTPSRLEERPGSAARFLRPEWRGILEAARLGTTGVISLRNFGIDLEEEGIVVFQELVRRDALEEAAKAPPEIDREVCLGVDLLIDLERILEIVHVENIEVTRERTIFKKTEERMGPLLITARFPDLFDGPPVHHLIGLCQRLNFFDQDGARLRCDPLRRRAWAAKRPLAKVREIFALNQAENRREHWSYHQGALREIFLELLNRFPRGSWVRARPLLGAVIATYLLSLRERGVEAEYRRRSNEDFQHEKLVVSLEKLAHDLSFWALHRLALLGLLDLGYSGGGFQAMRISPLGAQFFGLPGAAGEPGRMMVNPDFEILLFPGGEKEAEASLVLSRFADRTASEKVKRHRVTSESVKRGVISGLEVGAILAFLEKQSAGPLPPNVRYSVREWGEGVESIQRQRVLLLRARTREGAERLLGILETHGVTGERLGDNAIVVPTAKGERVLKELKDSLRDQGLYLE